jgi:hypothetical protein
MTKYIIEIPDDVQYVLFNGKADNKYYTAVRPIAELEELNSDYINENFGELQDEAYQRGFEDGKKFTEKGCEGCKYVFCGDTEDPCWHCRRCYKDKYEPAPPSDRIEVGDEVEDSDGDKTIVTNIHGNLFDGLCSDGFVVSDQFLDDNHKTGKHYDIASILEAMRK